jgi:ankyrin repeat protein
MFLWRHLLFKIIPLRLYSRLPQAWLQDLLIPAAQSTQLTPLLQLVHCGVNLDAHCNGLTPLQWAIVKNLPNMAEQLLLAGADPNSCDLQHRPTLHYAAYYGRVKLTQLLLQAGALPNTPDPQAQVALMYAAFYGHLETLQLLLSAGATVNAQCQFQETALHFAAYAGQAPIVQLLLKAGANNRLLNVDGCTASQLAQAQHFSQSATMINDLNYLFAKATNEAFHQDKSVSSC